MHEPQIVRLTTDVPELEGTNGRYAMLEAYRPFIMAEVQQYKRKINVDSEGDSEYKQRLKVYKAKFEASAELLSKIPFYQCMIFVNSVPR